MQVIYSGGSNTPTPSPRLQRKTGYGRPVMPGYMTHVHPQILVQRSREKLTEGDTTLRDCIPAMSTCVASFCLVLNIFIPGSGTLTAGLSILCCSRVRHKGGTKRRCILVNAGVALMQFLLTFLFLLGWIWSITWGVAFLSLARKYKRGDLTEKTENHTDDEKGHSKTRDKSSYSPNSSPSTRHHRSGQHEHQMNSQHHHHHHSHNPHKHHHHPHNNHHHNKGDSSPNSRHSNSPISHSKLDRSRDSSPVLRHLPNNNPEMIGTHNRHTQHHHLCPLANNDHSCQDLPQPIIVLQKAPGSHGHESSQENINTAPGEIIMQARSRHMKMMQRKISDNDLSPFVLTNQQLQAIVIHDLPIVGPSSSRNNNTSNEDTYGGLPKL